MMTDPTKLQHVRYAGEWTHFMMQEPPVGTLVRFWHEYTGAEWTACVEELHPAQGIAALWWKPTGIARLLAGEHAAPIQTEVLP